MKRLLDLRKGDVVNRVNSIGKVVRALKKCSKELDGLLNAEGGTKGVAQHYETIVKLAVYGYNDIGQRFLLNSDDSSETAITVEAVQYTGHNGRYLREWSSDAVVESLDLRVESAGIFETHAHLYLDAAAVGMWVVKFRDTFYICNDEEFAKQYNLAD